MGTTGSPWLANKFRNVGNTRSYIVVECYVIGYFGINSNNRKTYFLITSSEYYLVKKWVVVRIWMGILKTYKMKLKNYARIRTEIL